jgi:hypothetical protein
MLVSPISADANQFGDTCCFALYTFDPLFAPFDALLNWWRAFAISDSISAELAKADA